MSLLTKHVENAAARCESKQEVAHSNSGQPAVNIWVQKSPAKVTTHRNPAMSLFQVCPF